jgi:hypothetical protein
MLGIVMHIITRDITTFGNMHACMHNDLIVIKGKP